MYVLNVEIKCDDSMLELKCVYEYLNMGVMEYVNEVMYELNEVVWEFKG